MIESNNDKMKKIVLPKIIDSHLAEECGLHLGDGSMNLYKDKGLYQLRGHLVDDKPHYEEHIVPLYRKLYNLDVNLREMPSTGVVGFQVWDDELVQFKHRILALPLGKKNIMTVTAIIIKKGLLLDFIRGLFDTDGSFYIETKRGKPYPRIDIKTVSKCFAEEIQMNLWLVGIGSSIYRYRRSNKEIIWIIYKHLLSPP